MPFTESGSRRRAARQFELLSSPRRHFTDMLAYHQRGLNMLLSTRRIHALQDFASDHFNTPPARVATDGAPRRDFAFIPRLYAMTVAR